MNPVIKLLKSHRSIRKFSDKTIDKELLQELIVAGQSAATSSFLQGVTVIRVSNSDVRAQIAELAGNQTYVQKAAEFLVFCADLKRSSDCCRQYGKEAEKGYTEQFIIATVDTALFAQNVATAAESVGLGICFIGGIRNDPAKVSELLKLPKGVYPVFGFCLGYPAQDPELKPRLPLSVIFKEEAYTDDKDGQAIAEYDQQVTEYYRTRTGGRKEMTWTEQMSDFLAKQSRPHMKEFLKQQGFEMK